jgi:hypothetical protein
MADVSLLSEYKLVLEKGKFNGIRAHYNIRKDPDLGLGWAAIRWVACRCASCKAQLKMPWVPRVERRAQPRYAKNNGNELWPSYEGANDWQICELVASTPEDERCARESNK